MLKSRFINRFIIVRATRVVAVPFIGTFIGGVSGFFAGGAVGFVTGALGGIATGLITSCGR